MTSFLQGHEQMRTKKQTFTNSGCHIFAKFSSTGELWRIQGVQQLFSFLKLCTHECTQASSEISQIHTTACTALQKTSQSSLIYQHLYNRIQKCTFQVKQSLGYYITCQVSVSLLLMQKPKAPGNPHFVVERVFMNRPQLLTREPS